MRVGGRGGGGLGAGSLGMSNPFPLTSNPPTL